MCKGRFATRQAEGHRPAAAAKLHSGEDASGHGVQPFRPFKIF